MTEDYYDQGYQCDQCGNEFEEEPYHVQPPGYNSIDGLSFAWCEQCWQAVGERES